MVPILKQEVATVRQALGDVPIALNAAPGELASALKMARAFHAAGGDIYELNCHGTYGKLFKRGLLRSMPLPENRAAMTEWLAALCDLAIPIVVKFHSHLEAVDFQAVLKGLEAMQGLFGVHFNIRSKEGAQPNLEFVRLVRPHVKGTLFCSGHVTTAEHIKQLLSAGVDCVGISQGVIDQPAILAELAKSFA